MFIKRFLLASGSLKDIAGQYVVTYPSFLNQLRDNENIDSNLFATKIII